MRSCKVYVNKAFAGVLKELDRNHYTFSYDERYLETPNAAPVSVNLPLSKETYSYNSLFPLFSNMLSEGFNRHFQLKLHHLDPEDEFGLLLKTATYDTIGSITVEEIV